MNLTAVPVLADANINPASGIRKDAEQTITQKGSGEARESTLKLVSGERIHNSSGGSQPLPIGGTGIHGIKCTCETPPMDVSCPLHGYQFKSWATNLIGGGASIASKNQASAAIERQATPSDLSWLPRQKEKTEWKTPPHPAWCYCKRCEIKRF